MLALLAGLAPNVRHQYVPPIANKALASIQINANAMATGPVQIALHAALAGLEPNVTSLFATLSVSMALAPLRINASAVVSSLAQPVLRVLLDGQEPLALLDSHVLSVAEPAKSAVQAAATLANRPAMAVQERDKLQAISSAVSVAVGKAQFAAPVAAILER